MGWSRSLLVLALVASLAACASPIQFRWPEQVLWPGDVRVLTAGGGAVDIRVHCLGPGVLELSGTDQPVRRVAAGESAAMTLPADSALRLATSEIGGATAVSVECEVRETVQLRFEPAAGSAPSRIDFDGQVAVLPGAQVLLRIEGERAVTSVADPGGAALRCTPSEPIAAERILDYGDKHVFRGAVELRLSVDAQPTSASRVSIRNADSWSIGSAPSDPGAPR